MTAKCIEHREHPMLFSAPMVRALLADRKHVTRRLSERWLKVKAGDRLWVRETHAIVSVEGCTVLVAMAERIPPGKTLKDTDGGLDLFHIEDRSLLAWMNDHVDAERWRPSIFMPRAISRILLECQEDARLEHLQDITEQEAREEGVRSYIEDGCGVYEDYACGGGTWQWTARGSFSTLWSTLHTKPGERWEDNPMVIRVGRFRRIP